MPSESSFKKHAEIARDALKNFTTVRVLNAPTIVKTAVFDLIDAVIAFYPFIPFFLTHDLFRELAPTIFNVLNDFAKDNPSFVMPKTMDKVASLNERVQSSINPKRGMSLLFFIFLLLINFFV
jgi:hypothetical protein